MEIPSNEIIEVLSYLLPGFVAAWVYYGLTAFLKPPQFERIIQALIFTIIIQVILVLVRWVLLFLGHYVFSIAQWTGSVALVWSLALAVAIGLLFAKYTNNDQIHRILRSWGLTRQTSYPSEWFGVFAQSPTYVVLHLKDQRRLYGWPEEWPSQPDSGHFSMAEAEWLTDSERIQLTGVQNILIPAEEVLFVEFMLLGDVLEKKEGDQNGSTKSPTAAAG